MLGRYSIFKYKTKKLAQMTMREDKTELTNRFTALMMGLSTIKGLVLDLDLEDAEFISQQYGGVKDILEQLENALVAAADMPRSFLLGSPNGGAFSEQGESDRYQWAHQVAAYQNSVWKPELMRLLRYVLLAKDSGTPQALPKYDIAFRSALQLTRKEVAQLKYQNAQSDDIYLKYGVLTPDEVRNSRFGRTEYSDEIVLSRTTPAETKPQEQGTPLDKLKADIAQIYDVPLERLDGLSFAECLELRRRAD